MKVNINDIEEIAILRAMLEIMTPLDIYKQLPGGCQADINIELEDALQIEIERE